jgi:hypothetical protein
VVSPLMLALTTRAAIFSRAICCSSSATQPLPRCSPYSADRLSPTTRITGVAAAACAGASAAALSNVRLQCSSQARRVA